MASASERRDVARTRAPEKLVGHVPRKICLGPGIGARADFEEIARRMDIPVDAVRKTKKIAQLPMSFETPLGDEGESHLGDFIEDKGVLSPSDAAIDLNLKDQIASILRTLTPREERIIRMRFGLDDGSQHTLEEVGEVFAVTRERIRQIEAKALRKLRHPSRSGRFQIFIRAHTDGESKCLQPRAEIIAGGCKSLKEKKDEESICRKSEFFRLPKAN